VLGWKGHCRGPPSCAGAHHPGGFIEALRGLTKSFNARSSGSVATLTAMRRASSRVIR
jgi:hypothetical protein